MPIESVTTAHLDYAHRLDTPAAPLFSAAGDGPGPELRRMLAIRGVAVADRFASRRGGDPLTSEAAALAGLFGQRCPVAYQVVGDADGVGVSIGTWGEGEGASDLAALRVGLLSTAVGVPHEAVTVERVAPIMPDLPWGGLVLGRPDPIPPDSSDGALPIDRVIAAMAGRRWASLVLAVALDPRYVAELRQSVLNELRAVQTSAVASGAPSPLAVQYEALLQEQIDRLSQALASGGWRVAVYLVGDRESFPRLSVAWQAVYARGHPIGEALRVHADRNAAGQAVGWGMPYGPGAAGPGGLRHPFAHQTLLTSVELAAYVHLPARETLGFSVEATPTFDTVSPVSDGASVSLGRIVDRGRPTTAAYQLPVALLSRHALVSGVTGSGKSTTVRTLLHRLDEHRVPWLVIEPAKREYRALLAADEQPTIYTAGDELTAPLRLNPFESPPGIPVATHLDLLRSVFAAGFGMWTPLPQVLERCLHLVYADRGWDLATGSNVRLGDDPVDPTAWPTLSDLSAAVRRVVPTLQYDQRVAADIAAALQTRIDSLRAGGKGRMLDGQHTLDVARLLDESAVIELEPLADDEDKAFLMALLLTRIVEHRRINGPADQLRHLLVMEEAHRLLAATGGRRSAEEADARSKAVETFANLLAEVRAYGQGILIADQVPSRLLPDAVKNTTTKIVHTLVSADDRVALAAATGMSEAQARGLVALPRGRAAVFSAGHDAPILIDVDAAGLAAEAPNDSVVAERMRARHPPDGNDGPYADCTAECPRDASICGLARRLLAEQAVQRALARLILSAAENPDPVHRMWPDLTAVLRARQPTGVDSQQVLRAVAAHGAGWLAARRGAQAGWTYRHTADYASAVRGLLHSHLDLGSFAGAAARFRVTNDELHARPFPPYQACEQVCPTLCLYRHDVADLILNGEQSEAWRRADRDDPIRDDGRRSQSWDVALDAAYALIEFPEDDWPIDQQQSASDAVRRVALCFAQQMLDQDPLKNPRTVRRITQRLIQESKT